MNNSARRIGLFGGTFDPIHVGHLRCALEVAEQLAFDELRLLPNAQPPHRGRPQVSAAQRLKMVQLAVAGVAPLQVDDRELHRDKPSYTIDTLESLRQELGAADQLFMLIGWDAFCGLPSWHRWQELLQHCHLLVLQRPDVDSQLPAALAELLGACQVEAQAICGPAGQIALLKQMPLAISATQIRTLLAQGRSVRYLVPDRVLNYIETQGLYQAPH